MDPSIKKPSGSDSVETIKASLTALGLPPVGKKETLLKRLKRAWYGLSTSAAQTEQDERDQTERERIKQAELEAKDFHQTQRGRYKAFLVLDIEGTCESGKGFDFPNEVIEFPVVLVRWRPTSTPASTPTSTDGSLPPHHQQELYVHDTFATYIRPVWRPKLTNFATSLTGITQDQVDGAPTFLEMLPSFKAWLEKHGLEHVNGDDSDRDWLWVTDGPFDLRDFIAKQSFISGISHPWYLAGDVLDLKDAVASLLKREWEDKGGFDAPTEDTETEAVPAAAAFDETATQPALGSDSVMPESVELGAVVPPQTEQEALAVAMGSLTVDQALPTPTQGSSDAPSVNIGQEALLPPADPSTLSPADSPFNAAGLDAALSATSTAVESEALPAPNRNRRRKGKKKGKPIPPGFYFNVTEILRRLGLGDFEGRQHSGIDDARNIARILIEVERRGILLQPNRFIRPGDRKWAWMGEGYRIEWGKEAQE